MTRTPVYITVLAGGATEISRYPNGFPVDGDALHDRIALRRRGEAAIVSDQQLLDAARAWLGTPLDPSQPPLTPAQVAQKISISFEGGASRFVAVAPSLQKVLTS